MVLLVDQEVWPRLTELAAKAKRAYVAVAYVGSDAHQLLKLKRGSVSWRTARWRPRAPAR